MTTKTSVCSSAFSNDNGKIFVCSSESYSDNGKLLVCSRLIELYNDNGKMRFTMVKYLSAQGCLS